jgi:peptidoglycan/LPS O-acetylase OafA/YrhL
VIVSVLLVLGGLLLWRKGARGEPVRSPIPLWILALTGALLVLPSFVLDFPLVLRQAEPPPFRWGLFGAGVSLGLVALVLAVRKRSEPESP